MGSKRRLACDSHHDQGQALARLLIEVSESLKVSGRGSDAWEAALPKHIGSIL